MSSARALRQGPEKELPGVGLEQQLDALFDLRQPLRELTHEGDAPLEGRQRFLECQLTLLQALDDSFQLGERLLEPASGGFGLSHHSSVASIRACARPRAKRTTTASPGASAAASFTIGPVGAPRRTIAQPRARQASGARASG